MNLNVSETQNDRQERDFPAFPPTLELVCLDISVICLGTVILLQGGGRGADQAAPNIGRIANETKLWGFGQNIRKTGAGHLEK